MGQMLGVFDPDREEILRDLRCGSCVRLDAAPDEIKADRRFMMQAVSISGFALTCASEELRSDRGLVMTAMSSYGGALGLASQELRSDRDLMMAAVSSGDRYALRFASEDLLSDRDIVATAVSSNGLALKLASEELRSDRDIVAIAVSSDGDALEFASEELRSDRNLVMTAVSKSWHALRYAPEELRSDSEILASTNFGSPPEALVLKATLLSGRSCTLVVPKGDSLVWIVRRCAKNLGLEGTTAGVLITSDGAELSSLEELQLGTLNEVTFVIP